MPYKKTGKLSLFTGRYCADLEKDERFEVLNQWWRTY